MSGSQTEYTKRMATAILNEYPQWASLHKYEIENEEEYFCLEVTAPSPNIEVPLRITTNQEEITVSFYAYHAHYQEFGAEAKQLINTLLSEKHSIVSFWHEDQLCGSCIVEIMNVPETNIEYPYANRIEVRTWSGLNDQTIVCRSRE